MVEVKTAINIPVSVEKVWQVLTDVEHYEDWNPYIRAIAGELELDGKVKVFLQHPLMKRAELPVKIVTLKHLEELAWKGRSPAAGLIRGHHYFKLNPQEDGSVEFIQGETFKGLFAGAMLQPFKGVIRKAFIEINEALRKRALEI